MWWFRKLRNKLFGTEYYMFEFGFETVVRPATVLPNGLKVVSYYGVHVVNENASRQWKRTL